MVLSLEIGQATFIEVIRVDWGVSQTCKSNIILGSSPWQNPYNRFDVNADGYVNDSDVVALSNWLVQYGEIKLPPVNTGNIFVDVDGDGYASQHDLQQLSEFVLNHKTVDTRVTDCYNVSDFKIERDLLDPSKVHTVKDVASCKNIFPTADYTPYLNFYTGLMPVEWTRAVQTKDSLVFVHKDAIAPKDAFLSGCSDVSRSLTRLLKRLQKGIFPFRYDPRRPLPAPPVAQPPVVTIPLPGLSTTPSPHIPTTPPPTTFYPATTQSPVTTLEPDTPIFPNPPNPPTTVPPTTAYPSGPGSTTSTTSAPGPGSTTATTLPPTTQAPVTTTIEPIGGTQRVLVICIFDQCNSYGYAGFSNSQVAWFRNEWGVDRFYWDEMIRQKTSVANFDVKLLPIWVDRPYSCSKLDEACQEGIYPLKYMAPSQVPARPSYPKWYNCTSSSSSWLCMPRDTTRNLVPIYSVSNQIDEVQLTSIINKETGSWTPTKIIWILDSTGDYSFYNASYHDAWVNVSLTLSKKYGQSVCTVGGSSWPKCQLQWNYYTPTALNGYSPDEARWLSMATDAVYSLINKSRVELPEYGDRAVNTVYDTMLAEMIKQSIDYRQPFNVYTDIDGSSILADTIYARDTATASAIMMANCELKLYPGVCTGGLNKPHCDCWKMKLVGPIKSGFIGVNANKYTDWGVYLDAMFVRFKDNNGFMDQVRPGSYSAPWGTISDVYRGLRRVYYSEANWPQKVLTELRRYMPI